MKKLLEKKECPYKAYLNSLGLKGESELSLEKAIVLKQTIVENEFKDLTDVNFVTQIIDTWSKDQKFSMDKERDLTCSLLIERITDFASDMVSMGATVVDKNVNIKKKIGVEEVFTKFDLVLQFPNDNTLYCCNIGQTHKSAEATKYVLNKNVDTALEWYLVNDLVKELYPKQHALPVQILMLTKKNFTYDNYFAIMDANLIDINMLAEVKKELQDLTSNFTSKTSPRCGDIYTSCAKCPGSNLCQFYQTSTKDLQIVTRVDNAKNSTPCLTPAQDKVIDADPGIYRVLAGAGTGKTTTLISKIVSMIQSGIDVKDILVITFSEKSIAEIKERLALALKEWYIEEISVDDFNIFTFNGYGDLILSQNFARFGYTDVPKLIDKIQKNDIVKSFLDAYPILDGFNYLDPLARYFGRPSGALAKMESYINRLVESQHDPIRLQYVVDEIKKDHPTCYSDIFNIARDVVNYMKNNNLIEYEDQISCLITLCTVGYEDLLDEYTKPNVICDEFQDTNRTQLQFIRACVNREDFGSLIMCGDDSQSIYTFRGADKTIIRSLEKEFKGLQDINMTENFRSTDEIVSLANAFNELDDQVIPKTLTSNKHGKPVQMIDSSSKGSTQSVVDTIVNYLDNGYNLYDIGVIASRGTELQDIAKELAKLDIPYFVSTHEYLRDNPKVKNLMDFSKYLMDTEKTLYLAEYLQAKDCEEFERQASIEKYVGTESERIKQEIEGLSNEELVDYFMSKIDEMAADDRAVEKLRDILVSKQFSSLPELAEYLSKMKKYEAPFDISKDEQVYDAITLMTAHAAKGREFNVIIGVLDNFKNKEDGHQCVFVTITRAREELVLIQDLQHSHKEATFFTTIQDLL